MPHPEGKAFFVTQDLKSKRPLALHDYGAKGDRIVTDKNARIAFQLPDGSHVRFDEETTFELVSILFNEKEGLGNTEIRLISGKIWVSMPRGIRHNVKATVLAPSAVVTAGESVFRVSVYPDHSAIIKVYVGRIAIRNKTWDHLIGSMHQIFVRSNGTATNPFRFIIKADRSSWVQWNQTLDEKMTN